MSTEILVADVPDLPIREMMTTKIHENLMVLQMTSISPKSVTAPTLTATITTNQITIHAATCTSSVQNLRTVLAACSSLAMVMQKLNQYAQPRAKAAAGSTNLPDH